MQVSRTIVTVHRILILTIGILMLLSLVILTSIASSLFPLYYLYFLVSILIYFVFSRIDFEIFTAFSLILYILSILFLMSPLLVGEITRGAVRWLQLGSITLQPSELVRPFIFLYFAHFISTAQFSIPSIIKGFCIVFLPVTLILVQPSFGVALLTAIGFIGIFFAANIPKRYFFIGLGLILAAVPILLMALAPYQRQRIESFLNPSSDPLGAGYNSLQSMISIGSGKIFGRGLGEGIQTQLAFLPEKHSDFVFAAVAEEMGLIGSLLLLVTLFVFFMCLIYVTEHVKSLTVRSFTSGVCLSLFAETVIHTGMNMGILPITGVPLPLVSAGGSALIGTMMCLGLIVSGWKSSRI